MRDVRYHKVSERMKMRAMCGVTRDLNAWKMREVWCHKGSERMEDKREVRCHKGSECMGDERGAVSQGN